MVGVDHTPYMKKKHAHVIRMCTYIHTYIHTVHTYIHTYVEQKFLMTAGGEPNTGNKEKRKAKPSEMSEINGAGGIQKHNHKNKKSTHE